MIARTAPVVFGGDVEAYSKEGSLVVKVRPYFIKYPNGQVRFKTTSTIVDITEYAVDVAGRIRTVAIIVDCDKNEVTSVGGIQEDYVNEAYFDKNKNTLWKRADIAILADIAIRFGDTEIQSDQISYFRRESASDVDSARHQVQHPGYESYEEKLNQGALNQYAKHSGADYFVLNQSVSSCSPGDVSVPENEVVDRDGASPAKRAGMMFMSESPLGKMLLINGAINCSAADTLCTVTDAGCSGTCEANDTPCTNEDWSVVKLNNGCDDACEVSCQGACEAAAQTTCSVTCQCGHEYTSYGRCYWKEDGGSRFGECSSCDNNSDPHNLDWCVLCDAAEDLKSGQYVFDEDGCGDACDALEEVAEWCATSCEPVPNCGTSAQILSGCDCGAQCGTCDGSCDASCDVCQACETCEASCDNHVSCRPVTSGAVTMPAVTGNNLVSGGKMVSEIKRTLRIVAGNDWQCGFAECIVPPAIIDVAVRESLGNVYIGSARTNDGATFIDTGDSLNKRYELRPPAGDDYIFWWGHRGLFVDLTFRPKMTLPNKAQMQCIIRATVRAGGGVFSKSIHMDAAYVFQGGGQPTDPSVVPQSNWVHVDYIGMSNGYLYFLPRLVIAPGDLANTNWSLYEIYTMAQPCEPSLKCTAGNQVKIDLRCTTQTVYYSIHFAFVFKNGLNETTISFLTDAYNKHGQRFPT